MWSSSSRIACTKWLLENFVKNLSAHRGAVAVVECRGEDDELLDSLYAGPVATAMQSREQVRESIRQVGIDPSSNNHTRDGGQYWLLCITLATD